MDFLLFLALGPAALGVLAIPFINHVPHMEQSEVFYSGKRLTTGIPAMLMLAERATLVIFHVLYLGCC